MHSHNTHTRCQFSAVRLVAGSERTLQESVMMACPLHHMYTPGPDASLRPIQTLDNDSGCCSLHGSSPLSMQTLVSPLTCSRSFDQTCIRRKMSLNYL